MPGRLEHEMDSLGLCGSGRRVRASNCVSRGKEVEAGRVEGQTVDLAARLVGWFDEHLKG